MKQLDKTVYTSMAVYLHKLIIFIIFRRGTVEQRCVLTITVETKLATKFKEEQKTVNPKLII